MCGLQSAEGSSAANFMTFPLSSMIQGLANLTRNLFHVDMREVDFKSGQCLAFTYCVTVRHCLSQLEALMSGNNDILPPTHLPGVTLGLEHSWLKLAWDASAVLTVLEACSARNGAQAY